MKLAGRLQLRRAGGAARQVLLQFVTGVVGQLVIDMQQNILLDPFALHSFTPSQSCGTDPVMSVRPLKHLRLDAVSASHNVSHRMSARAPRSFCVARKNVFFAVSSVVFRISPTVRNFNP